MGSDRLSIVLPLPPAACSPNARAHWRTKHRAMQVYREAAYLAAMAAIRAARPPLAGLPWQTATEQATFAFRQARRRDADNLLASLKAAFDGLADAGVVIDDCGLTHRPVRQSVTREAAHVEIVIERGEDA